MPSPEASRRNLAKAKANWRPPRLWRSRRESQYIKSLVWQWFRERAEHRCSARKLAGNLGVSHTWVNTLKRRFLRDPEKQARQESVWGAATIEQLHEEQANRRADVGFIRYRPRRIRRSYTPRPDSTGFVNVAALEHEVKEILKKQRNVQQDYGHI